MKRFTAIEWWELRGRGWVANIDGITGFNPRPLVGQQVEIDGTVYTVKGVETYMIPDPSGMPFGLLVAQDG